MDMKKCNGCALDEVLSKDDAAKQAPCSDDDVRILEVKMTGSHGLHDVILDFPLPGHCHSDQGCLDRAEEECDEFYNRMRMFNLTGEYDSRDERSVCNFCKLLFACIFILAVIVSWKTLLLEENGR